jgi:dynein heavy chain, axonemal
VPIDTLTWSFNVFEEMKPIANTPDEGVYIQSLYLEGASWSLKDKSLSEPKLMELVCQMPAIHFLPVVQAKRRTKS